MKKFFIFLLVAVVCYWGLGSCIGCSSNSGSKKVDDSELAVFEMMIQQEKEQKKEQEKKKGADELPDYVELVEVNDFEKAHQTLKAYSKNYSYVLKANGDRLRYYSERGRVIAAATEYMDAVAYIYCAEARYLMAEGGENAQKRMVFLFNEIPLIGQKLPSGTHIDHDDFNLAYISLYLLYAQTNNRLCDTVFDIALNMGDKRLASIALSHYLDIPSAEEKKDITYSSETKDAAKERFEEAVNNGLFD